MFFLVFIPLAAALEAFAIWSGLSNPSTPRSMGGDGNRRDGSSAPRRSRLRAVLVPAYAHGLAELAPPVGNSLSG